MTDQQLMQAIKTQHGEAINEACHLTAVPDEFLAAMVANESGGDPTAKRFEKNVLGQIWQVLMGRAPSFGSITNQSLKDYLNSTPVTGLMLTSVLTRLDDLANSWGLTQIMGYNALAHRLAPESLRDCDVCLDVTVTMLEDFAKRFDLVLGIDFAKLFTCWNTGRPNGTTFDPNYVSNGLARMAAYKSL